MENRVAAARPFPVADFLVDEVLEGLLAGCPAVEPQRNRKRLTRQIEERRPRVSHALVRGALGNVERQGIANPAGHEIGGGRFLQGQRPAMARTVGRPKHEAVDDLVELVPGDRINEVNWLWHHGDKPLRNERHATHRREVPSNRTASFSVNRTISPS